MCSRCFPLETFAFIIDGVMKEATKKHSRKKTAKLTKKKSTEVFKESSND